MRVTSVITMLMILSPATAAQSRAGRQPAPAKAPAVVQPAGQALPIRRVVLYSNGVAYYERRGTVSGSAEINLPFKQSQVDDVLKSMLVLDLGRGRIGAVSSVLCQGYSSKVTTASAVRVGCPVQVRRNFRRAVT